jgi:hypothetical protein
LVIKCPTFLLWVSPKPLKGWFLQPMFGYFYIQVTMVKMSCLDIIVKVFLWATWIVAEPGWQ